MNHKKLTEQLLNAITLAENALRFRDEEYVKQNTEKLERNLSVIAKSFSGSWLGYHSKVYYQDFIVPAPGDHFSVEWGLMHRIRERQCSAWVEVTDAQVEQFVMEGVDKDFRARVEEISISARKICVDTQTTLSMLLTILLQDSNDPFLKQVNDEFSKGVYIYDESDLINQIRPRGIVMSRDTTALTKGNQVPSHVQNQAWIASKTSPFDGLEKLIEIANKILKYMDLKDLVEFERQPQGAKIFIGHGQSSVWREITHFLKDKGLDWIEFNRDPVAGFTIQERLKAMLDQSGFALIVMTSEDEHKDASLHARENVIHECGLFQGRLGLRRTIILVEEGCETFSNIQDIVQLRFPKKKIGARFPDLRKVLEREGFLPASR